MTVPSCCLMITNPVLIVNHNNNKSNKKTAPIAFLAIGALLFFAKNNIDYALALSFVTRADFFLAALFL